MVRTWEALQGVNYKCWGFIAEVSNSSHKLLFSALILRTRATTSGHFKNRFYIFKVNKIKKKMIFRFEAFSEIRSKTSIKVLPITYK